MNCKYFLTLVAALTFTTWSTAQTLPYSTGFDSASEQNGWQVYQLGDLGPSTWGMSGGGFSMPNGLTHDYNVGAEPTDTVIDWIVSPALEMTGSTFISLKFRESGFSTPTVDNCEVYIGTGSPDPAAGNFTLIGNISTPAVQWEWEDAIFSNDITGAECYLAFRYKTIGAAWCTYAIDDVTVELQNPNTVSENLSDELPIMLSPNPASSWVSLGMNETATVATIGIFNISGQFMKSVNFPSHGKMMINVEDLPAGIYAVSAMHGNHLSGVTKLVVSRRD